LQHICETAQKFSTDSQGKFHEIPFFRRETFIFLIKKYEIQKQNSLKSILSASANLEKEKISILFKVQLRFKKKLCFLLLKPFLNYLVTINSLKSLQELSN
jgi:small-conductance mechanosensitive channel